MHRSHQLAAVVVTTALLLAGCSGTGEAPGDALTESTDHLRTARLISHVTDGVVSRDDAVSVRFADAHADREDASRALTRAFVLTPAVEGVARWEDDRTLVFEPRTTLVAGQRYQCVLDVAAVLPGVDDAKPFAFGFEVAPNRVVEFQLELQPENDGSPERMLLEGSIGFQDVTTLDLLRRHATLRAGRDSIDLEWRVDIGDRRFEFTSEVVERAERAVDLVMTIPAAPFGIERDLERSVTLRPVSDMSVTRFTIHDEAEQPRVSVSFSDPLDESRDLSAFVSIQPHIDLKVSALDRELLVTGPFSRDTEYTLTVRRGIANRWGGATAEDVPHTLRFVDLEPQIAFSQAGSLLPSRGNRTIAFRTLNVGRVTARVVRVFESNLGQFLQDHSLVAGTKRERFWGDLNRVGVEVAQQELVIGETRNAWQQSMLDLAPLLEGHERGLYVVTLSFDRSQMLYECSPNQRYPYYDHPCGNGYAYNNGVVSKPVIHTDIGLIAKRTDEGLLVAATHLADARPLPGVELTLASYQNQPVATATTDGEGMALLDEADGFFLEGRWRDQRTVLKFDDTKLSFSGFEVGGASGSATGLRAFVYADRGVHRPGDTIFLSAILRARDGDLPDDQPIGLKVRNPRGQVVHEAVTDEGLAGHYAFEIDTQPSDPTGNWFADLSIGDQLITSKRLRVETVAPNRLKVNLALAEDRIGPSTGRQQIDLSSTYLFGAPAADLQATVDARFSPRSLSFDAWVDYDFNHPARVFQAADDRLFDGRLDGAGRASFGFEPPSLNTAPGAVMATLTARVFEKGGRPTTQAVNVPVDPYPAYVGLNRSATRWAKVNEPLEIAVVAVDADGNPLPGRRLAARLYHNTRYWWWEYRTFDDYRRRFKSDVTTRVLETVEITSGNEPVVVPLTPSESGQILIEIVDLDGGHGTGAFLWASNWGRQAAPIQAGSQLEMEVDREAYEPGDVATVSVTTPPEGLALVSVEKGPRVLEQRWLPLTDTTTTIEVPVTEAMLPNVYVHVLAIQPHAQTTNDQPMRLHGVVPLSVEKADTRLPLEVEVADTLRPNEEFEVVVRAPRGRRATVTVAVVDEGLLDLTRFATPDPWGFFFAKEALGVSTFDVFDLVIGAIWGDVHRRFEIGGDEDSFRTDRAGPTKAQRFPPVALFSAPQEVGRDGTARVRFTMPHYLGSVRVMAVAAAGASYGSAEATTPVRDPIVILPSLPRVAGPSETFAMPVTVFALEEGLGPITLSVSTEGPLGIEGEAATTLDIDDIGDDDRRFRIRALNRSGVARVTVRATSERFETETTTELEVRPVNPFRYGGTEVAIDPRGTATIPIPALGIEGTRQASLRLTSVPGLRFGNRLQYLIRYPYGCMEQTMSAVFPQLKMKPILISQMPDDPLIQREIDDNINAGIRRLQRFVTPEGGFGYWPGSSETDQWATNYGGHFLLEARRSGYHVPKTLMDPWLGYQKRMAAAEAGDLKTRCYRLFLLAHAGEPNTGAMNLMKEERMSVLDPISTWFLATAYHLAGMPAAAAEVLGRADIDIADYRETGGTFGTALRDTAIMLYLANLMDRDDRTPELYSRVNTALGTSRYLNTHETGYCLLAVGDYLGKDWLPDALVRGTIRFDGRSIPFERRGATAVIDVTDASGSDLVVESASDTPIHAVAEWEGIPVESPTEAEFENLSLKVRYLTEDGSPLNPSTLEQGTVFWCHLKAGVTTSQRVENVALVQIFPSGWEIDATRLRGEAVPSWARRLTLGAEAYLDIRDDRAMWFFDLYRGRELDFLVKLIAVTEGEYILAPASAEAMYDRDFRALVPGQRVQVVAPEGR